MIFRKISYFILCVPIILELTCIDYKPASFGSWNEIVVLADEPDWRGAENTFREIFEKTIRTPQKEKIFSLQKISPSSFGQIRRQKNIIVFSSLNSKGRGAEIVRGMLSQEVQQGVKDGNYYVFVRKNEFANNQLFMLLVANTIEDLMVKMNDNKGYLFSIFHDWVNGNIEASMYKEREQYQLEKELYQDFDWTLRVQHDYKLIERDEENKLIWFRRRDPDRFLIVHWIPSKDGRELTNEWVINKRNWIGNTYIDSMEIEEQFLTIENSEFFGRFAIHLQGLWKINKLVSGGPFQTWAFYHAEQKRIYLIDICVFAPGKDKMPHIQRLDIMANTFSTDPPGS